MSDFHGVIFAYGTYPELGELSRFRTAASMPFCGRYRLIDFALSSMMNAGIHNVGVIMQRDYQSLLDHIGAGKDWDMDRRIGGLKMLPPFGLPEYHTGDYTGTIEALNAVSTYIRGVQEKYIVLMHGNLCANLDLSAAIRGHVESGADITAICTENTLDYKHHRYVVGAEGFVERMVFNQVGSGEGLASLEAYIIAKDVLIGMMDACASTNRYHFHRDAISDFLSGGGRIGVYTHKGYARRIMSTASYYSASLDMLNNEHRADLFTAERPIRTKSHVDVSTYYGEKAFAKNSLVADGCIIRGELNNCIVFSDARIGEGAKLSSCIVMNSCIIGEGVKLNSVIADKYSEVGAYQTLSGSERLPIIIPKSSKI